MEDNDHKRKLVAEVVVRVHRKAIVFAIETNKESQKKHEGQPNSIVHDALFAISHDAVCTHQTVLACCAEGWSFAAGVLARTLMDLFISTIAITESSTPRLAAFKYFYSGYRNMMRDENFPKDARDHARQQCRDRLGMLEDDIRRAAMRFLHHERKMAYWYADEFTRPSKVLEHYVPAFAKPYLNLSAVVHGGFLGMRLFRDEPEEFDVNPRPTGRSADRVMVVSSAVLAHQTIRRATYEGLSMVAEYPKLLKEIETVKMAVESNLNE